MKVFYSWQSDTPGKVGRTFVREALEAAIAGLDLEDADRPEIDQDTKGVLGAPVIADVIFQKIKTARVVVADVTLTGQTPAGKRCCNSNVAIELGYALGIHGDGVLIKVMNTHYGPPQELPFDLAHRRWPVQFTLSPDADGVQRQKVRDALTKELRRILEQYIAASRPPPEPFAPTPSTYTPAAYWPKGEGLAEVRSRARQGTTQVHFVPEDPLIYLHIWPIEKIEPLTSQTLADTSKSSIEPLCGGRSGWSWERNRHGLLTYATYPDSERLASTSQVFRSGEIWGVNNYLLRANKAPGAEKYIPTVAYEEKLQSSLESYIKAARTHFRYPPKIRVESGLVNVAGFKLAMSNYDFWGPIYKDVIVQADVDVDKPETVAAALLKIFEHVFDAAGQPRPENHNGFPPKSG